ncbi:hypothetical protein L1999_26895 [Neobacillus drentensis]|uniref:hypothetical protein n=1 Tax=Neobacillus drentensis TaxID=220684 RepID=UPI001F29DE60|nr:hypothetical protein [Neobacillus drentensis]ULT56622.1 hypothetical protein L1999_26895 [Neobacillus drentensis]
MTQITFLASSKPFKIPDEIEEYNNRTFFDREEDAIYFSVQEVDEYWERLVDGLFSLPYIYEVNGVGNRLFLTYIEKYMEVGEVLEIYHVPNQHAFEDYKQRMEAHPEPIEVNVGRFTYQDIYGLYQLHPKKWLEELSHRNYLSHYGITTFIKY